ncbi:MAG: phosphatase PAP2 family protein [Muribaculaceae bacterium]|nr:phosphatase PAP2 family protein [Muribaculaceae bacterium]
MKTRLQLLALTALSLFCTANLSAQQHPGCKDHSTNPDVYFLYEGSTPNSLYILPGPPDSGSVQFLYDQARYNWGKSLRNTERGEQAVKDARVGGQDLPDAFSESFGIHITPEDTPEIYKLVLGMREDAGDLATRDAKNYYNRVRPFSFYGEETCNPEQQAELSTNGSYPSGHTSIGWAIALVLAEVNPDRQDEIIERGYQMGDSRVICGYHWQSDIDAGRVTGSAVVARLHADEGFRNQLAKAKKELEKKRKEGKVAPGSHPKGKSPNFQ